MIPPSLNWSTSCAAVSGFEVSSWYLMSSVSFLPPTLTPPLPLTTFLQTSYPSWVSLPSRASEPVSEIDAPSDSVPPAAGALACSPLEPQPATLSSRAAAAVVERNKQVMADSSGADDTIFTKGYQRTFAVLSPATSYAASMIEALNDLAQPKPKTIAFVSADDGFSKTVTKGGVAKAQQLGFTVVATEYVPNGTSDVSSALTKIKPKNPDVIIGSVHLAEGVAIIKQSKELGVNPAGGFGETVAPPTPDFAQTLGAAANGVLGSTQWTVKTTGSDKWFGSAKDYNATFAKQFNGRDAEYHGAEATAACLALVLAVEKANSTEPDKVRDTLAALDEQTFFGPLKFNANGQNVTKTMGVIQVQGGKPVAVWPKDSSEAPLVWPGAKS